ncbi:acetoacetate--CoA ligase [Rhodococcus wratislaviensis]|uniref:Putative acetoacetyl-coenzyme A synthetase n=1 Tax=Rhodococcus wratislaviensis NBRC 100605 TaxID=1219028 RepID=X0PXS6_RHOWR|nr:acetoacetate--CoA ligase [Rhodococcus wratislaviensis]GAF48324.1 putative acetoacetyl-coenzyme A synthetase [Rhodococcus wratislaviensis NBRC 100605]
MNQVATPRPDVDILRQPRSDVLETTDIGRFAKYVSARFTTEFTDYQSMWQWSVSNLEDFWSAVWDYYGIRSSTPPEKVMGKATMPGAEWFRGARLNYAEHLLNHDLAPRDTALIGYSQTRDPDTLTWEQLREAVARTQAGLQRLGVQKGDRVVAYLPNITETVIAYIATIGLGAIWASCAPEFGARSVIDRFAQLEPKVLLTISGYNYGDKAIDRRGEVDELRLAIPSLEHVVEVPYGPHPIASCLRWEDLLSEVGDLVFEQLPFDHPMCVLFSSGTTGLPKAIVHGHGGLLLEHTRTMGLTFDLRPSDRFMWFTTTAWMMWNIVVSSLLRRGTAVLFDGNPMHPGLDHQFALASQTDAAVFGTSPSYLMACRKAGLTPKTHWQFDKLRQIGVTGAPLPAAGFDWVYDSFDEDILLNSVSGGTDVCGVLVGGSPWQPVVRGEISGPPLGVDAVALDDSGAVVVDQLGELCIRQPMPSMPLYFWNDGDGERYRRSYFDASPGVWRHGDWIMFRTQGSCVIAGRSDSTLNRGGVRLGTSEFYKLVEDGDFVDISDSLVVHLEDTEGGPGQLVLFVVHRPECDVHELRTELRATLRSQLSPRHVPDAIISIYTLPRTMTGKKLEAPIKKILKGAPPNSVVNPGAITDAAALNRLATYEPPKGQWHDAIIAETV